MANARLIAWTGLIWGLTAATAAAAGSHEGAAPSPFTGNIGNAIWTLLIFGLVVLTLGRFAWRPMLEALQKREEFIRESLESARRDREAAQAALRDYESRIAKAREEASAIVEEGRRDAELVRRRIEEEARASADQMIERAKREIGIARDTALRELYEQSARLATTMAGNLLKRQITAEDQERLVEEAVAQIEQGSALRN